MLSLTKYTDNISYNKIFKYLQDNYKLKPRIIHSDFEASIAIALNENNIEKENLIFLSLFKYDKKKFI